MNITSPNNTPRENRRQSERNRKRQDILKTAERLFAERGFHRTKMEDIAESSGYAVGALYKYFKSKDEIYLEITQTTIEQMAAIIRPTITEGDSIRESIRNLIREFAHFFHTHRDFFRLYVNEMKGFQWNLKEDLGLDIHHRYQNLLKLLEQRFAIAITRGEMRADVKPLSMAIALLGILNAFFTQWVAPDESEWDLDAREIEAIFWEGVHERK